MIPHNVQSLHPLCPLPRMVVRTIVGPCTEEGLKSIIEQGINDGECFMVDEQYILNLRSIRFKKSIAGSSSVC